MILAPSILSADFSKLAEEIAEVESHGCNWLHLDVMDGHFVPNLTLGPPVVKAIRSRTTSTLDCHLMVQNPEKMIPWFVEAGADWITVHYEATSSLLELVKLLRVIKGFGKKAGVSVKPATPVQVLEPCLAELDLVLVMSVEPGFGGQKFMPESLHKVAWLAQQKRDQKLSYWIQIDGGIHEGTLGEAHRAGVEIFVAGSAIFSATDRGVAIQKLKEAAV